MKIREFNLERDMGNDIATKQNCAQPQSPRLTFDGLTDDSFCFAYTVASTTYSFDKGPDLECLDYYVQGGDGESVVNTSDICPRGNKSSKQNQQAAVIQTLRNAGFQRWTKWMYALSEALTPMTLQSSILKANDNSRRKEMKKLDDRITEAKKVLCWHDGYMREKDGLSPLIVDALEDCLSPEEVEKNKEKIKSELEEFKKSGDVRHGTPDISAWGPSLWKSLFSLEGRAEKIILEDTVKLNSMMVEDAEETLLLLDLPNTLTSMTHQNREQIKEFLLKRRDSSVPDEAFLKALSTCDIETLAFIKSAVPTLANNLQTDSDAYGNFLASQTFLNQAQQVLTKYNDDIGEARIILESALEYYKDSRDRQVFLSDLNEVRNLIKGFPRLGNYEDLDAALTVLESIQMNDPEIRNKVEEALRLTTRYHSALALDNAADMELAVNAKIFMIDEFARRSGRTEFGKVLLATLWMNRGLDASSREDRTRRFVRAQELLRRVERCRLSAPEVRWFDEVNRFLNLLGAPVRRPRELGCLEGQIQENNQCWETAESCMNRDPSEAFDAGARMCVACSEGEHVKPVYNAKKELVSSSCEKDVVRFETKQREKKEEKKENKKEEAKSDEGQVIMKTMSAGKYDCTFDELANIKSSEMAPAEKSRILKERKAQCR